MKRSIAAALASWVISFHGLDYQSVTTLLDSLPKKVAQTAKIFTCFDESHSPAICVAYDEPKNTVQEDGSRSK